MRDLKIRSPYVSGTFYPNEKSRLEGNIKHLLSRNKTIKKKNQRIVLVV
ncbi:MAG: hypothetical protein ACPKPY_07545 [Nitrososphaeraceae archaeon]